jgi:hypothetical protein
MLSGMVILLALVKLFDVFFMELNIAPISKLANNVSKVYRIQS